MPAILTECRFELLGGRLFLTGVDQSCWRSLTEWTQGVRRWVAWEAVEGYLVFDSLDEYYSRLDDSRDDQEAAEQIAAADRAAMTAFRGATSLPAARLLSFGVRPTEGVVSAQMIGPPDNLRIPYEEWPSASFNHVGRCADGRQFMAFVTGAFPAGYDWQRIRDPYNNDWQRDKRWLAVLHLFDAEGQHIGSEARLGGYNSEGWETAGNKARAELEKMLSQLGSDVTLCDVYVKPFSVVIDGVTHGLFYKHYADGDFECESTMLEPRDIMFHPPWDSGEYST